jgi:hypothetical protein
LVCIPVRIGAEEKELEKELAFREDVGGRESVEREEEEGTLPCRLKIASNSSFPDAER